MFIFLSKFLPLLIYPAGLACLLVVAALVLRKKRRWQTWLLVAALLVLFVGGNRLVAMSLVRSLEWRYLPPAQIQPEAAIVVLGGGTEAALYPRPAVEVNSAGDRVLYAARLYKEGKATHILLSGGYITWLGTRNSTPAQEMADILELTGVPSSALWLQSKSQNTYEDALYSSQMLKDKGITHIILVTSAVHMPRAVALFRHQGLVVTPAPADYTVTLADWQNFFHASFPAWIIQMLPTAGNMDATSTALKEYIGLAIYGLRGWTSP